MAKKKVTRRKKSFYVKHKFYHVVWKDHSSGYGKSWTHESEIDYKDLNCETVGFFVNETDTSIFNKDLNCETVGFFVNETDTSIFLALSKYEDFNEYSNVMQILKSCIVSQKQIK